MLVPCAGEPDVRFGFGFGLGFESMLATCEGEPERERELFGSGSGSGGAPNGQRATSRRVIPDQSLLSLYRLLSSVGLYL